MTLLTLQDIACVRGGRLLFAGLNLQLSAGDAVLVRGPNGVGKSSLVRIAAGLLKPAAGAVLRPAPAALSDEALVLDLEKPLARALEFWALAGEHSVAADRKALVQTALHQVGLDHLADVPVRMLSTGQRKRAGLARVLASGAPLWLLDEPANGLDSQSVAMLGELMAAHCAGGGAILATSHLNLPITFTQTLELSSATASHGTASQGADGAIWPDEAWA